MLFFQSQRVNDALIVVVGLVKIFKSGSANTDFTISILLDQNLLGKGDPFINVWIEPFAMTGGSILLTRHESFTYQDWGLTIALFSSV